MALGRRKREQQQMWVATTDLPRSAGHVFYERLNEILAEAGFDSRIEELCRPYYHSSVGRPSIPPGVYFRMLLVGYFEGIGSQRGIAWRCADSLSLRAFLGIPVTENTPDHSSLTRVRDRLPMAVHEAAFQLVLEVAARKRLLRGKTVAVDSTTLEACAAMKSIVRRETGEDWNDYLRRLMQEELGVEDPSDEDIRRFDKGRKGKKVSNEEWVSTTDPDSRIARMKDGRTHLAYKAEHVVDLDTEFVLAAEVYQADVADTASLNDSVTRAQTHLHEAGTHIEIKEAVADKGYHAVETIALSDEFGVRTYIPERKSRHKRRLREIPTAHRRALLNNRRRIRGDRSRRLQRLRSELVERSFAHVCDSGGSRRTFLWGIVKVQKRYLIAGMARNLGLLMRKLFQMGTPRGLQVGGGLFSFAHLAEILTCGVLGSFLWLREATRRSTAAYFTAA